MKFTKLCSIFSILAALIAPGIALAAPITVISQADNWDYNFGASLGSGGLTGITYADFTSGYTGASNGDAAFGNTHISGAPYNTYWGANSAVYLQKTVNVGGLLNGDATLNLAVDNGSAVFVNGTLVFNENAGGFTNIWEYTQTIDGSLFVNGSNTISVIANDYGGATYWDMEITADVPEPGLLPLLTLGLLGLGLKRRRQLKTKLV